MRERWIWRLLQVGALLLSGFGAAAQGTKQWTVSRFDELERGAPDGVAIRSDGRLEAGPAVSTLYTASSSYIWAVAAGSRSKASAAYAGLGGTTGGSAAVVRLAAGGKPETIFSGKELGVQALRVAPDGTVYAATSPDGKVYRLGATAGSEQVIFDPAATPEKPKYLWDLATGSDGAVYTAAGAPAAVYRVLPGRGQKAELLFRTADQHIRSLLMGRDGVLWAGSDGAGVIYRFETRTPGAKPFAAYASGHREITSLAMDGTGSVYAAAVGARGPGALPPLPVTGQVGITVTFTQPGSATAAGSNGIVPDGSEIDRIAPDGTPERLITLKDDVVYALAVRGGHLLAATGNRGRIYRLDVGVPGQLTEVARTETGQATSLTESADGVLAGTSNNGKVLQLSDTPPGKAIYTSEVFDAGQFARWGRFEAEPEAPGFRLSARTGNVPNAIEGWSAWLPADADGSVPGLPAGRYAQWRAETTGAGTLHTVTLNYLPRNIPPVVDEVVVVTGARVAPGGGSSGQQPPTVQVAFPATASGAMISASPSDAGTPLTAQKDRTAVTLRWAAHDDNGDDLLFAVLYRGAGETNWRLLKDKLTERYLSFDAALLPDGRYEVKVLATDAAVHAEGDGRSGERVSNAFTVDTTPPVPGALTAQIEGGRVHWTLGARDAVSPIARAEYSLDSGPWQYAEPVGALSDAREEHYDLRVSLPAAQAGDAATVPKPNEHVLAVRVFDRAENVASVKAVVH